MNGGRFTFRDHVYKLNKLRPRTWIGATVIVAEVPGTKAVAQVFASGSYVSMGFAVCRRLWKATPVETRRAILAHLFGERPTRLQVPS